MATDSDKNRPPDKKRRPLIEQQLWDTRNIVPPQQANALDCGVFSLAAADTVATARDSDISLVHTFAQAHCDEFRKHVLSAILKGGLAFA